MGVKKRLYDLSIERGTKYNPSDVEKKDDERGTTAPLLGATAVQATVAAFLDMAPSPEV